MPNVTQLLQKRVFCWVKNAKLVSTMAWMLSLVLVLIAFIVACVAASRFQNANPNASAGSAAGFAAVWTTIMLVFISVSGTIIMRKYCTALAIGLFLGIIFIMANQMLILFVVFADYANREVSTTMKSAEQAMASFAFFLFLVYSFFGSLLAVFRNDIIKAEAVTEEQQPQEEVDESGEDRQ